MPSLIKHNDGEQLGHLADIFSKFTIEMYFSFADQGHATLKCQPSVSMVLTTLTLSTSQTNHNLLGQTWLVSTSQEPVSVPKPLKMWLVCIICLEPVTFQSHLKSDLHAELGIAGWHLTQNRCIWVILSIPVAFIVHGVFFVSLRLLPLPSSGNGVLWAQKLRTPLVRAQGYHLLSKPGVEI